MKNMIAYSLLSFILIIPTLNLSGPFYKPTNENYDPVTNETTLNWAHQEWNRIFQPGMQTPAKRKILEGVRNSLISNSSLDLWECKMADRLAAQTCVYEKVRMVALEFFVAQVKSIAFELVEGILGFQFLNKGELVDEIGRIAETYAFNQLHQDKRLSETYANLEEWVKKEISQLLSFRGKQPNALQQRVQLFK